MWQRGTNFMDGTMSINGCGIPPGTNASYVWYAQNPGTAWYHSHRGMQYTDGLYGAIVIHSPNEPASKQPYDDELTLMIGDVYNTRSRDLPTKTTGRRPVDAVPDGAVINGVSQARCAYLYPSDEHPGVNWCGHVPTAQYEAELVGGKTYRIRIVNSGSLVPYTFSIDNHTFSVIEADGVSLAPYEARTLSLDVGHRYSILVTLDQPPAAYWMRVHLEVEAQVYKGPKFNATTLGVLRYKGARGAPPDVPGPKIRDGEYDAGPRTIFPPAVPLEAPLPTLQHSVVYGAFLKPDGSSGMTFNDRMWRPLPDGVAAVYFVNASNAHRPKEVARLVGPQHNLLTTQPEVVDLIVNAPHDLATHPFHLHGHSFWIMSQGPGVFDGDSSTLNRTNPMRRDTFVVPPGGHAVIRFVADNPGIWPLHCHIAWHLEGGLLMTVTAMPREMVKFDIPPHMKRLCYKQYA
ncbi:Cupredoxin [Cutaneotrichosporon oleaginosum]|uniref:Cupredoxin n=1 Tax=Cutaneotrichosporon oleaginosum TaxID=879819 RepID=A0A0J0XKU7_9TREE|nr:Cupredoxin [Cutaneotrichosporon oleaginosum]KLT41726.1 Cupredoxin [Cutaneotrichosporon oleaginosum]TXT12324.1 hypothetical protein COLE_02734 [Cutaneotrichosporon oleaginosum]